MGPERERDPRDEAGGGEREAGESRGETYGGQGAILYRASRRVASCDLVALSLRATSVFVIGARESGMSTA